MGLPGCQAASIEVSSEDPSYPTGLIIFSLQYDDDHRRFRSRLTEDPFSSSIDSQLLLTREVGILFAIVGNNAFADCGEATQGLQVQR